MDMFREIQSALSGYKTYIILGLMMVVSILEQEGVLEVHTAEQWTTYLMLGGGATLTAKLNRWSRGGQPTPPAE